MQSAPTLERLGRRECMALLRSVNVGRIGLSVAALPTILPVNFIVHGELIVVRTAPGTKLDAARHGNIVAFEVDDYQPGGAWGWSVLVRGAAAEISDPARLREVENVGVASWALSSELADRFIAIEMTLLSGRRFTTAVTSSDALRAERQSSM